MKKIAILTAALWCAIGICANAEALDIGCGWSVNVNGGAAADSTHYARITDEEAHSGENSLKINYPDGAAGSTVYYEIMHDATSVRNLGGAWNDNVAVECYIKSDSPDFWDASKGLSNIMIGPFDCTETGPGGTFVKLSYGKVTIGDADENGWRKVSFVFKYPYGMTSNTDTDGGRVTQESKRGFKIRIMGHAEEVYIDDIKMYYAGGQDNFKGTSYLSGGDFELSAEKSQDSIEDYGWSILEQKYGEADIVKDGENAMLRMKVPGNDWSRKIVISKELEAGDALDGHDYEIRFKAKGAFSPQGIQIRNGSEAITKKMLVTADADSPTITEIGDGWYDVTVKMTGSNLKSSKGKYTVDFMFMCGATEVYFDDFSIVKYQSKDKTWSGKTEGDYIKNGTFDDNTKASTVEAKNWNITVSEAAKADGAIVTRSKKYAYSDDGSIFMSMPGSKKDGKSAHFSQKLPEEFDYTKDYTLKFKLKTLSADKTIRVYYGNAEAALSAEKLKVNSETFTVTSCGGDWYEYRGTLAGIAQPADGTEIVFSLDEALLDGVWLDDVSLADEAGTEYIVNGDFADKTTPPDFIAEEYKLYKNGKQVFNIDAGVYEAKVVVENNFCEPDKKFTLIMCHMRGGKMIKYEEMPITLTPDGEEDNPKTLSCMLDMTDCVEGDTLELFLWDSLEGINIIRSYCVFNTL